MRKIKVVKFELYPADEPVCYAVGFSYEANGRSGYIVCVVPLAEAFGKNNEEVVQLALNYERQLDDETTITIAQIIAQNLAYFEAKSPVIGLEIDLPG